mmetsp:Transcript_37834/g.105247  ORF Transcript_37834/g.105247 Transcript_37834/m.105247 type:complete len:515 (-) Transcript_37834:749-2293(-)
MMDFCRFSLERRPCSVPAMMEARSSSSRTMSAASFATSVPRTPSATPTSACRSAGASLTPSPVIPTMSPMPPLPKRWNACTMTRLWSGDTRAKTRASTTARRQKPSTSGLSSPEKSPFLGSMPASWGPVITSNAWASRSPSCTRSFSKMPRRAAIAQAVAGWSPVTITTVMPASWARRIASATPRLGGSSMPNRPTNSKPSRGKLQSVMQEPSNLPSGGASDRSIGRCAAHSTRLPKRIKSCSMRLAAARCASSIAHSDSTCSGAPLINERYSAVPSLSLFAEWTVSIHLFSELNGISNNTVLSDLSLASSFEPPTQSMLAFRIAASVGEPTTSPAPALSSAVLLRTPTTPSRRSCSSCEDLSEPFCTQTASIVPPGRGTARSCTAMTPVVIVPVLSEHSTETHPSVSMASSLLTSTCRFRISAEATISENVTVGSRPSGTCVNRAVAQFSRISMKVRCRGESRFAPSTNPATHSANLAATCARCFTWHSNVEGFLGPCMLRAISPRNVLSPVA